MNESRLTDLESTLAFQERTIQDLSDVICRQQQDIDGLAKRGVTVALSRANQSTTALLSRYHLLELIGKNRLYPTNRHVIAAFRQETGQATPETIKE